MQLDQRTRLKNNEVGHSIGPILCSLFRDRDARGEQKTGKSKSHEDDSPKEREHRKGAYTGNPQTAYQEGDDGGTAQTNILNESWNTAQAAKAKAMSTASNTTYVPGTRFVRGDRGLKHYGGRREQVDRIAEKHAASGSLRPRGRLKEGAKRRRGREVKE